MKPSQGIICCKIVVLCVVATTTTGLALFSTVKNYGDWQRLSPSERSGYARGAFDRSLEFNPLGNNAYLFGIQKCVQDNGMSAPMLVTLIDKYYENHPDKWKFDAAATLDMALSEVCASEINAELKKVVIPALVRPSK